MVRSLTISINKFDENMLNKLKNAGFNGVDLGLKPDIFRKSNWEDEVKK